MPINSTFKSPRLLSYISIGFFSAFFLIILFQFFLAFGYLIYRTESTFAEGEDIIGGFFAVAALLRVFLWVGGGIAFLAWQYRALANVPALGTKHGEFTPGWALFCWFIPIMNLWKPFKAMKELWQKSDSDFHEDTFVPKDGGESSGIVDFWWGAFITSSVIGYFSNAFSATEHEEWRRFVPVVFMVSSLAYMLALYLIISIVNHISKEQERRFEKISSSDALSNPPPPPVFETADQGR